MHIAHFVCRWLPLCIFIPVSAGMLDNPGFEAGVWGTTEDPPGSWFSLAPSGERMPAEGVDAENYGQDGVDTPDLTSVAAHLKAAGGNAIQQTLWQVDAGTFPSYRVQFQAGYRRDVATAGDLPLRVSLLDPTDGTVFAFEDVVLTDPGVGTNLLSPQDLTLNVNTASFAGRPIAIRFANLLQTPSLADAWSGTVMLDNIEVTSSNPTVPPPAEVLTAVAGLVERLLPGRSGEFQFEFIAPDAGRDVFEIESGADQTVVIRGNRTLSLASGFHWYLKHTADCHVSWNGNQLDLASPLPVPEGTLRQVSPYRHRNQGNVTQASYTQAYWSWERWEEEIDFMALNGITQAVVVPGHQKVWQETLSRIGYSEADILAYLPNLGHNCWWLFGNLEGEGGPLTAEVIEGEAALGRQIADRMRSLGIEPIVYAYVGLVPNSFSDYFPAAQVVDQGQWIGFARPDVLSPLDSLFGTVAAVWYEELQQVFGEVSFLSGDLFHEGGNTGGLDLTASAAALQAAMQTAIPESVWVIQSWGGTPNSNLVAGTDLHQTLIQQLISDLATGEGEGGGFRTYQGRPWTWNEISNFGGNNGLYGNLRVLAGLPDQLLAPDNLGNFSGLGVFMEAIEVNPIYMDLLTDMFWRTTSPDLNAWLVDALRRRYGAADADAEAAWALLRDSVYDVPTFQFGVTDFVMGTQPGPDVNKARIWGDNAQYWDPWEVAQAADRMLTAANRLGGQESFRFDLIDILRQTLNDYTYAVYQRMMAAYRFGNVTVFEQEAFTLLTSMEKLDALLATHPQWMIGPWIADARAKASDTPMQERLETNARQLVTTWKQNDDPGLNDYASRSRSGLMRDYYVERWRIYIEDLRQAMAGEGSGSYSGVAFEQGWRDDRSVVYPTEPAADTLEMAQALWDAVGADLMATAQANSLWKWRLTQGGATEVLNWDVSSLIAEPTRLAVLFDYQAGAHALEIAEVRLLRNGQVISSGGHAGWTGAQDRNHVYSLQVTAGHAAEDVYTLEATVSGSGGGDSSGVVQVTVPGAITVEDVVGRYRRNSVVVGQHVTIDLNADFTLQHYQDGVATDLYDQHRWALVDGMVEIRDALGTLVSLHTLTGANTLSANDGPLNRMDVTLTVQEWAIGAGLTGTDAAAEADPDGDGWSNFVEFALGSDPQVFQSSLLDVSFAAGQGLWTFVLPRPALYQTLGLHYRVESCERLDPANWHAVTLQSMTAEAHPTDNRLEVLRLTTLQEMGDAFYRLVLSGNR